MTRSVAFPCTGKELPLVRAALRGTGVGMTSSAVRDFEALSEGPVTHVALSYPNSAKMIALVGWMGDDGSYYKTVRDYDLFGSAFDALLALQAVTKPPFSEIGGNVVDWRTDDEFQVEVGCTRVTQIQWEQIGIHKGWLPEPEGAVVEFGGVGFKLVSESNGSQLCLKGIDPKDGGDWYVATIQKDGLHTNRYAGDVLAPAGIAMSNNAIAITEEP